MLKCDRFCNELAKAKDPRWEDRLIIIMEVICKMFDLKKGGLSGKYLGGCLAFINVCGRALAATGHAYVISDLIGSDFRLLEGPDWWSTAAERRRKCRERNSPQAATEAEVISRAYQRTGPLCHHDFTLKIFTLKHEKRLVFYKELLLFYDSECLPLLVARLISGIHFDFIIFILTKKKNYGNQ